HRRDAARVPQHRIRPVAPEFPDVPSHHVRPGSGGIRHARLPLVVEDRSVLAELAPAVLGKGPASTGRASNRSGGGARVTVILIHPGQFSPTGYRCWSCTPRLVVAVQFG